MSNCEQFNERLSGYLDGELTQGDRQRIELHLETCSSCRGAYEQLAKLRQDVGKLPFETLPQDQWSEIMSDLTVRTSRTAGWLLYLVGLLVIVGYGTYCFAVDSTVDAIVKTCVGAMAVGGLLLLFSVIRERWIEQKTDRYKDIER